MNFASERWAVVATVDPQTVVNSEALSDEIDMSKWHEIMAILLLGNMASETIDFALYDCGTSGGTFAAITSKSATQLAAHASNNDNKQIVITCRGDECKRYVKARTITGGATGGPAAVLVLGRPRIAPGSDDDLASVAEIVN
jgi:hypothetical protein